MRGADLRMEIEIELIDAVKGGARTIRVPRLETCERCEGSGAEPGSKISTCGTCNGRGEVRQVQQSVFGRFVNVSRFAAGIRPSAMSDRYANDSAMPSAIQRTPTMQALPIRLRARGESGDERNAVPTRPANAKSAMTPAQNPEIRDHFPWPAG